MIVLTREQIRNLDRICMDRYHIPGLILMENAARGLLDAIALHIPHFAQLDWHLFCYKGNNGGDGLALARHLFNRHCRVTVWMCCDASELLGDALINYRIVESLPGIRIEPYPDPEHLVEIRSGVVVDALLGTGLQGGVQGKMAELIDRLNHLSGVVRMAIDIPSGLMADTGNAFGEVFKADFTVTMAYPKPGLMLYPGREFTGTLYIAHISQVEEALNEIHPSVFIVDENRLNLPIRRAYYHKGSYGKVSLVMGSSGFYGAGLLSAKAVLRSGAGMARWYGPAEMAAATAGAVPEVMLHPISDWSDIRSHWAQIQDWSDILAVGPGIGRSPEAQSMMSMILDQWNKPLIIDADGLNNLHPDQFKSKAASSLIITPHPGEFCRLMGISFAELAENPLEQARKCAVRLGVLVILKTVPAIMADPSGLIFLNHSGNDGMATAGSGDVLTGILAGLWAQHLPGLDVMTSGVFLHGRAGDLAASSLGKYSLTAGSIIDFLPQAFKTILNGSHSCSPHCHPSIMS
ncbi:MAG: NAD(P)H-hydrate dehydratase [Candidatus Delongbacteria bacterium]|nr:NAD(P)H-hydrate dehydratase [Candidatus Delongbacteria bacterium]